MKVYLLIYDNNCGTEDEILRFIDTRPEILNWQADLPSSIFLISKKKVSVLSKIFQNQFSNGMFVLTLINSMQTEGLLDFGSWDFINNPKSAEIE